MDGAGYMDRSEFELLLKESNLDFVTARDTRYNAVLHLVTAADGAEVFYTLANNQTRTETAEEARDQDLRTQKAWAGHPHHIIIDNHEKTFDAKLQLLVAHISAFVGLPTLNKDAHKYILADVPDFTAVHELNVQMFSIEKIMLEQNDIDKDINMQRLITSGSKEPPGRLICRFIRRRSQGSMHVCDTVRHHSIFIFSIAKSF